MAGSLIKVDEEIVTSAVSSVTLTGIDSTYDVYMVKINKLESDTDNSETRFRVTTSGTPDTSSNYDRAYKLLRSTSSFINLSTTNASYWFYNQNGNNTGEQQNGTMYLFNFNNASEYSFITFESAELTSASELQGLQGGAVHTVAQASDGIQIFVNTGNIDNGTFTLYGLKK